ncbi:GNAT family N-acetyltransferase [Deinococcus multiflagellatus]|uniref:GNAT family N-acetyltransferase n=1 Tax=Deinococcus multiflagellatus TaxID=1656887 RepID=A0ABW1ZI99_9DEIO
MIDLGGQCIGMVNRAEEDPAGGGWWDLGVLIYDPAHWGQGLGTAALRQWVQATLDETEAHVLTFTTWSGNTRMLRAAQRLGFQEAGRVREARLVGRERHDSVRLDLLRREWPGGGGNGGQPAKTPRQGGAPINPPGFLATQDLKDRGWTPR